MKRLALRGLTWYQQYRGLRPAACRYLPTCSVYTYEAVEAHGVTRGLFLGTRRLLRCHPLGGHGHDPVPPPREVRPRHA